MSGYAESRRRMMERAAQQRRPVIIRMTGPPGELFKRAMKLVDAAFKADQFWYAWAVARAAWADYEAARLKEECKCVTNSSSPSSSDRGSQLTESDSLKGEAVNVTGR